MTTETLEIGTLVHDRRSDRIGRVMDVIGTRVRLRPPQGGREWQCRPEQTEPVSLASLVSVDDVSTGGAS